MIRINLLPPEYRKVEGTPVARLVTTVAAVALVAGAVGLWGWYHFAVLAQIREQRAQKEEELASLKAQADRAASLEKELKEYQRRRDTIEKIGASRILWSKKLDELADIIYDKGDTKRHLVWLTSLRTGNGRVPTSPAQLIINGYSGGGEYHRMSDFNNDIKKSEEFFSDFFRVDPPEGKQIAWTDDLVPAQAWTFGWGLDLKPPTWREKQ